MTIAEGFWPAVIRSAEVKVSRRGQKYLQICVETIGGNAWVNVPLVESMRWRYKATLEALGVDLQIYFEWDGVDLADEMAEALAFVLPDKWCYIWVRDRHGHLVAEIATD